MIAGEFTTPTVNATPAEGNDRPASRLAAKERLRDERSRGRNAEKPGADVAPRGGAATASADGDAERGAESVGDAGRRQPENGLPQP
jgi:hypothetical protein